MNSNFIDIIICIIITSVYTIIENAFMIKSKENSDIRNSTNKDKDEIKYLFLNSRFKKYFLLGLNISLLSFLMKFASLKGHILIITFLIVNIICVILILFLLDRINDIERADHDKNDKSYIKYNNKVKSFLFVTVILFSCYIFLIPLVL